MEDPVDFVRRSLAEPTRIEFEERVKDQAAYLREEFQTGDLDNANPAIGLELELYAANPDGKLAALPPSFFDRAPAVPELGRHNAEINTTAAILSASGITNQLDAITEKLDRARRIADRTNHRLVLDGMWTIPPEQGTLPYLSDTTRVNGIRVADNMHRNARYYAIDNAIVSIAGGQLELDLPGVSLELPSILVESLTTSIQPHLQIPTIDTFPAHFNAAIRTLGPVLALATNSPFLPADLYSDAHPQTILEATHHELRIPVFEQSINAGADNPKVRLPRDITTITDIIQRLVDDRTVAPFLKEWVETKDADRYAESFWELDHKHGTYWRWIRPVIGGDYINENNTRQSLRIEYRSLPTQPSIVDTIGLQCLVAGLVLGLVAASHPIQDLDWTDARTAFYNAVEDGLDAELYWITEDNEWTTNQGQIYGEIFRYAKHGLQEAGVPGNQATTVIKPIEARWHQHVTPTQWKLDRVREQTENGVSLPQAIRQMQLEYIQLTLEDKPLVEWD